MMHSRGFVLSENQAFAGQTRTPGPSRLHASPTRKNMTTGKKALGQSSKLTGQDLNSAGPKQLFGDLKASQSPVKALGNRNASKTPGPSRLAPGKQDASAGKGKGASGSTLDSSPTKKGSSELSPRKASTSNALRSLNGKQRQTTDLPFSKPGQNSSSGNDASSTMLMKTPAPSQLGKARAMSRQNSFVTPAANVGRAGAIKARMGEMMDAEMGLSLQKGDNATEQVTQQPAVQMTEEEMYPEIEYMPPSHHAKHPVFEFPDELDDLPRAKELGAQLSRFSAIGLRAAGPDDLSDVEVTPMEELMDNDLVPPTPTTDSDDDDPWPDVPVTEEIAVQQKAPSARSTTVAVNAGSKVAQRPLTMARPLATGAGVRTSIAQRGPVSSSIRPSATSSTTATSRAVPGKATPKPVLNPKLIDFVDDDLGKQTAAALDRMNADEVLEPLQLDLGEVSELEA
uniref:Uncharacterized protein n=1 Tax=Kalmanozyma brasiliensis (strain GHG001) TaxID=1365824 RepID=V5E9Q1_KALBG